MSNKKAIEVIKSANKIAIFGHREPDPDACGSTFGLQDLCQKLGKKADVFICDTPADFLFDVFPFKKAKFEFHPDQYDLVIVSDLHSIDRLSSIYQQKIAEFKNVLIVDHHIVSEEEKIETKNYVIKHVAAASMIVVDLFQEAGVTPSKNGATYLYAGMMGDTDRFLHNNLTPDVFDKAAYLMKAGAAVQKVYDAFYRKITRKSIATQKALYSKMKFVERGKAVYTIFTTLNMKHAKISIEDVKAFSNSLIRIDGVKLSFLIYQLPDGIFRVSMRSSGDDLVPFANKMNGGGHNCAAAFNYEGNILSLKHDVKLWVKEILNV